MFTGIVESVGSVRSLSNGVLTLDAPESFAAPAIGPAAQSIALGESVLVNGCCLTVVETEPQPSGWSLKFDLSPETLARTSLGALKPASKVNLERAMVANGRFGGHVVQGHVDAKGKLVSIRQEQNSSVFRFQAPVEYDRYLIDKGSVTIEGISLTVVEPLQGAFDVWIIPHTLAETNLGSKHPGDDVNMEFDVIAKYVEKLIAARAEAQPASV